MSLFACTFKGFATMYIEANNEGEARNLAWQMLFRSNDCPEEYVLNVKLIP